MKEFSKKALFIVNRDLYYKFYSPIISELLQHDFIIFLAHDYGHPRFPSTNKNLSFVNLFKIPQFERKIK